MVPRLSALAASLTIAVCVLAILAVAAPGTAAPAHPRSDETATATATPASSIYLPVIANGFTNLPTATPTEAPTGTPTSTATPTATLAPACPLPAQRDDSIILTVSPNRNRALEQMVGKVPFTVNMSAAVSGGAPPYTYCWDLEPDGHQDAVVANPTFTLSRAGAYQPLIVVFDAQGQGQYTGVPPAGSPALHGGRP